MTIRNLKIAYLGCPYTHVSSAIRQIRQLQATRVAGQLMQQGLAVFSPITHGHQVADHIHIDFVRSHGFWMEQCLPIVRRSDLFVLLPLEGWRESRGLADELECCSEFGVPVYIYQRPNQSAIEILKDEELEIMNWKVLPDPTDLSQLLSRLIN